MKTIPLRPVCAAVMILCASGAAWAQDAGQAANGGANQSDNARAAATRFALASC
jgi:hypothetical protein